MPYPYRFWLFENIKCMKILVTIRIFGNGITRQRSRECFGDHPLCK